MARVDWMEQVAEGTSKVNFEELKFTIQNGELGKGGFGTVHKATYCELEVAVKRMENKPDNGFQEEMLLSKLRHPNIVTLMVWAQKEDQIFLVFELLVSDLAKRMHMQHGRRQSEGFTITNIFEGHPPPVLKWKSRVKVAIDIARGLAYLHGSNPKVFHRDIKAANILLDEHGTAKLADFGCAVVALKNENIARISRKPGTIGYVDPLYLREDDGIVSEHNEVYSYGIVLFQLLCALGTNVCGNGARGGDLILNYSYQNPWVRFNPRGPLWRLDDTQKNLDPRAQWPNSTVEVLHKIAEYCTNMIAADSDFDNKMLPARPRAIQIASTLSEYEKSGEHQSLPDTEEERPALGATHLKRNCAVTTVQDRHLPQQQLAQQLPPQPLPQQQSPQQNLQQQQLQQQQLHLEQLQQQQLHCEQWYQGQLEKQKLEQRLLNKQDLDAEKLRHQKEKRELEAQLLVLQHRVQMQELQLQHKQQLQPQQLSLPCKEEERPSRQPQRGMEQVELLTPQRDRTRPHELVDPWHVAPPQADLPATPRAAETELPLNYQPHQSSLVSQPQRLSHRRRDSELSRQSGTSRSSSNNYLSGHTSSSTATPFAPSLQGTPREAPRTIQVNPTKGTPTRFDLTQQGSTPRQGFVPAPARPRDFVHFTPQEGKEWSPEEVVARTKLDHVFNSEMQRRRADLQPTRPSELAAVKAPPPLGHAGLRERVPDAFESTMVFQESPR